ncbi:hypothetical protein [Winslowiella iniecta]|nr:hypothetical protein [Winslowiella iniecta]
MNSIQSAILIMLFASWTSSAVAGNGAASDSGVIHFHGAIVDGGCDINPQTDFQLKMSCSQKGKTSTNTAPLNVSQQHELPFNRGTTQFRWIDHSKKMAVLTVSYN